MNAKLKTILQVAEAVGVVAFPPAAGAVKVAHSIINKHGKPDGDDLAEASEAALDVIEGIKGTDVADQVGFRAGVMMVRAGFQQIGASLKHDDPAA